MTRVTWSLLIGIAILLGGIFFGVAGLLLFPILGVFVILAIVFWLAERKAKHKRPVD